MEDHFLDLADSISERGARFGVPIVPYRDSRLPYFCRLSPEKKVEVLTQLSHQRDFFIFSADEGLHPNSPKLIWRVFAQMGLTPQMDIFDKMTEEDTVEIYNWDSTSSFKNLKFFEFISHSVEELYTLTWMEQWSLSPRLILFFLEMNAKLKMAHYKQTFTPVFNRYRLCEKLGEKRKFDIHLKWISPVAQDGEKKSLLFVNRSSFATD